MEVLCFDMSSGGLSAARFDEKLEVSAYRELDWNLHRDAQGHATLSAYDIESAFHQLVHALAGDSPPAAVCIGCFMHSFLVLSSCCAALTPVFTWMDTTAPEGIEAVRRRFGNRFHERTGCHYHPMFPVFKLAASPPGRGNRMASPKAWLAWELTGSFVEDYGMASASGLLDVRSGDWAPELLKIVRLDRDDLPELAGSYAVVGKVTAAASERFGLPAGVPLVNGSGDGFLANVGSGCEAPARMAVTLGTSGAARQWVAAPSLNPEAGTFCYRAAADAFLLGCATSNGGNVLDWAREQFGAIEGDADGDLPVFFPWLNGERSLEWDPDLRPRWHGRTPAHTPQQLARAAAEGVLFNLAQYVEVIERESRVRADSIVLSGNGFREPRLAGMFAALAGRETVHPKSAGLATLRGAAICAWRALGHDATPALERLVERADRIAPLNSPGLLERFALFKQAR